MKLMYAKFYTRMVEDVELVCSRYSGLENTKANQTKLTNDIKHVVSYYKMLLAEAMDAETVSAKLVEGGSIQLQFSPKIQTWYDNR